MTRPASALKRLVTELTVERFGAVSALVVERPPTPLEMTRRRLVLLGVDDEPDDEKDGAG